VTNSDISFSCCCFVLFSLGSGGESSSFHLFWTVPTKARLKETEPTVLSALALTQANPHLFTRETNGNLIRE